MRACVLQHVPFEGLGSIGPWLEAHRIVVDTTRLFENERPPSAAGLDLLIAMGGPMSVNDERDHPWLADEKRLIRDMIEDGKPVLGVCLGAQLIASSLGSRVYSNSEKEIGWFPVKAVSTDSGDRLLNLPDLQTVLHWHGETFDLPTGAVRLAESEACANQAFQFRENVVGLQFHLETTPAMARELVRHCREELVTAKYVQSEDRILGVPLERYAGINSTMDDVLAFILPDVT